MTAHCLGAGDLWARILAVDERSHEYFAERTDWPGVALFTNPGAPPFNLAVIGEATEDAPPGCWNGSPVTTTGWGCPAACG